MISIRKMQATDRVIVEKICVETASPALQSDKIAMQNTVLLCATYYVQNCLNDCFVATNHHDEVIGYILCAKNYRLHKKNLMKFAMENFSDLGIKYCCAGIGAVLAQHPYATKHPAHLHIDILDEYQRQGVGHMLMDALTCHLREMQTKGVCLFVDVNNTKGVNFYKKYGFKQLKCGAMGLKL